MMFWDYHTSEDWITINEVTPSSYGTDDPDVREIIARIPTVGLSNSDVTAAEIAAEALCNTHNREARASTPTRMF